MKKILAIFVLAVLVISLGFVVAGRNQNKEIEFFEDNPESISYTTYHGKGIWSTTHILRKENIKPEKQEKPEKPDEEKTKGPACYNLMGVSWPGTPDYVAQTQDLLDIAETSIGTWDAETSDVLLGFGYINTEAGFGDINNPEMDEFNSYSRGDYPLTGVIAVCRTWRDSLGNIVEYDIMFDTDFEFGDCDDEDCLISNEEKMDFESIATHEIGHGFGLSDLYKRPCDDQTMYGYSSYGDFSKRTLESGDIAGIQTLYSTA